eukprot:jgi/Mesvir1/27175/Mv20835-RA.1
MDDMIEAGNTGGRVKWKNTLEEPVSVTILNEVKSIYNKVRFILAPSANPTVIVRRELRNWDLFGPLIFGLFLATMLSWSATEEHQVLVFATVFILVWAGAAVVTLNGLLLGGNIIFFQSVCLLGYCLVPLIGGWLLCQLTTLHSVRAVFIALSFVWSTYASVPFFSSVVPPQRRILAVYPVFLFYFAMSALIFV